MVCHCHYREYIAGFDSVLLLDPISLCNQASRLSSNADRGSSASWRKIHYRGTIPSSSMTVNLLKLIQHRFSFG
jgi:hypothetical protein